MLRNNEYAIDFNHIVEKSFENLQQNCYSRFLKLVYVIGY